MHTTLRFDANLTHLGWSPDGRRLAICAGRTVHLYEDAALVLRLEHPDLVRAVAFLPEGDLVTGCEDCGVRLWNGTTGELQRLLKGHLSFVRQVMVSPTGQRIATASNDGSLRVWNVDGDCLFVLKPHAKGLFHLVTLPGEGWRGAASCGDGSVTVWDLEGGARLERLAGTGMPEQWSALPVSPALAPSPDGALLLVSARETLQLWQVRDSVLLEEVEVKGLRPDSPRWSPDGRRFVLAHRDRPELGVYSRQAKQIGTLAEHYAPVQSLAFVDSDTLLTGGEDGRLLRWSIANRVATHEGGDPAGRIEQLLVSPNGGVCAAASNDMRVTLWPLDTLKTVAPLRSGLTAGAVATPLMVLPLEFPMSVLPLPDGTLLTAGLNVVKRWRHDECLSQLPCEAAGLLEASSRGDRLLCKNSTGNAYLLKLSSLEVLARLKGDNPFFAAEGEAVVLPRPHDGTLFIADSETGQSVRSLGKLGRWTRIFTASPTGSRFVWGSDGHPALELWDLSTLRRVAELTQHGPNLGRAEFSPDGTRLATFSGGIVEVFDSETGESIERVAQEVESWGWVAWTPDSRTLVFASGALLGFWREGDAPVELLQGDVDLYQLLVSPCGRYAFAGSGTGTVYVCHLADGQFHTARTSTNAGGAWSPDGERLLVWARTSPWDERLLRLIDPDRGELLATLPGHARDLPSQAGDSFHRALFSADSTRLATVMWPDSRVRLWSARDGQLLGVLGGHSDIVRALGFSLDQRLLYTGGGEGVRVWDASEALAM